MQFHPHVHLIVPGGGLAEDGSRWRASRSPEWFLPVKAVAAAFKAGFEEALRSEEPALHASVPDATWRVDWTQRDSAQMAGA